jgi:hypothetical protein
MLRREKEKGLGVSRGEYHPLLLSQIHIKEIVVMQTPSRQTLSSESFSKALRRYFQHHQIKKNEMV